MLWCRMIWIALRLTWPYVLTPWRSPLLRWRIETYGLLDDHQQPLSASQMSPRHFVRFCLTRRRELLQFLRWAASLP